MTDLNATQWAIAAVKKLRPGLGDLLVVYGADEPYMDVISNYWQGPVTSPRATDCTPQIYAAVREGRETHIVGAPGCDSEGFEDAGRYITGLLEEALVGINTAKKFGRAWAEQSLANARQLTTSRGILDLKNIAAGLPVFCVAAGPSLDTQGPFLKEARKKGIVLAVNHSAGALRLHGVDPDYMVVLESQDVTSHIPEREQPYERLIISLTCHPKNFTIPAQAKHIIAAGNCGVAAGFANAVGDATFFVSGPSAATMMFSIAAYMGAKDIVMVGMDSAYTDDKVYAQGSLRDDARILPHDGDTWVMRRNKDAMDVPDAPDVIEDTFHRRICESTTGGNVNSSNQLLAQRTWIERHIPPIVTASGTSRVINCSPGGANIKGAHNMNLEDLLAGYADRDVVLPSQRVLSDRKERLLLSYARERVGTLNRLAFGLEQAAGRVTPGPTPELLRSVADLSDRIQQTAEMAQFLVSSPLPVPKNSGDLRDNLLAMAEMARDIVSRYTALKG